MRRAIISDQGMLDLAHLYAQKMSGCRKVQVGSVITDKEGNIISFGANVAVPNVCTYTECQRVQLYGEDSKNHRLPSDCRSVHSEIDAIINAKRDLTGCTIYITRYPCEACARAIIRAGITRVVYGRNQVISNQTRDLFDSYDVLCYRVAWTAEDTTR